MNWKQKAKEIAERIYNDAGDDPKEVGGYDIEPITVDGKEYNIEVSVFWESIKHFDYTVYGISDDFREDEVAVAF